ncbi:MAG: type IV secretory system conjugative DNA transfer family protein [bacterium]|nr:type IV secretory system conjugative DNA transfer family protein [bacterium]
MVKENSLIVAQNQYYSLDCYETQLNNNVLVVGASGAGKTRSIVIPNLLQATGSYIVSDPKGNLYGRYKKYLEREGYVVKKLDFTDPAHSAQYNPFHYIHNTQDIVKVAHMIVYQNQRKTASNIDPFWEEASQLLLQSIIAYLIEMGDESKQNFEGIQDCLVDVREDFYYDILQLKEHNPKSYAVRTFLKFYSAAERTMRSVLILTNARLACFETPEIYQMTGKDTIDIPAIGQKKTALFVVVSDTDRSLDGLVNIFFTQAMNELCMYADKKCEDNRLPVPVRFILDDFATNCKIAEFPRMIASIRSRGISTMLMIQAESQLQECYDHDGKTIIGNCDTYVYLGGNDVETAKAVAERCNIPPKKVLNMPIGTNWIFRRGQEPVQAHNFELEAFLIEKQYIDTKSKKIEEKEENIAFLR